METYKKIRSNSFTNSKLDEFLQKKSVAKEVKPIEAQLTHYTSHSSGNSNKSLMLHYDQLRFSNEVKLRKIREITALIKAVRPEINQEDQDYDLRNTQENLVNSIQQFKKKISEEREKKKQLEHMTKTETLTFVLFIKRKFKERNENLIKITECTLKEYDKLKAFTTNAVADMNKAKYALAKYIQNKKQQLHLLEDHIIQKKHFKQELENATNSQKSLQEKSMREVEEKNLKIINLLKELSKNWQANRTSQELLKETAASLSIYKHNFNFLLR